MVIIANKKGFNAIMTVIIVLVLLIIVAGMILLAFGKTGKKIDTFENDQSKKACINFRSEFCETNSNGCWDSREDFVAGKTCNTVLTQVYPKEKGEDTVYNCGDKKWYPDKNSCETSSESAANIPEPPSNPGGR